MGNEKSLRKSDGFLDDLINLFFLRPVFRESKDKNKSTQESSATKRPEDLGIKEFSNKTKSPNNIPDDWFIDNESNLTFKNKNNPTEFDKNYSISLDLLVKLVGDFDRLSGFKNIPEPLKLRFRNRVNSAEENDGDFENQQPLIPLEQIFEAKPRGDDYI